MSEKLVTKGIVLRATATKEADYILNILTDSLGRIAVVARGARRKGSRIAAGSELLAFSELVLYQRGNWYYLDEASTITLFDGIRQDIELLSLASYFAEMTECVTAEDEPVPEILSLLAELRAEKPVWVELGLQTIHASTATYIRRDYPLSVYDEAVRALHARGISVITHQILGLPGETPEMMVETARYIGRSGADGIKLHLLHVLTGTDLAADYAAGEFETLSLDAYITLLEACLRVLPREMVIHRLTGDGAKRDLLAPRWSGGKKRVINEIRRRFLADDLEQGSDLTDAPA